MAMQSPADVESREATILVVDDERSMREMLAIALRHDGYHIITAAGGQEAVRILKRASVDLLISDIRMPDMSGVDVLRQAKEIDQDIIGIMMTGFASEESAVQALNLGAHDYLEKPFNVDLAKVKVRKAIESRRLRKENSELKMAAIIGESDAIRALKERIRRVAPTDSTVLVTGESGTGKELVARAIHDGSNRTDRPFVAVNCGAVTETLLEAELFGHVKGAFTGADSQKKGLIEAADRGTIFLDEIGEMSPVMQVKLLRVVQERKFRRVGGTSEMSADIRVVAATNRDLARMVTEGTFREDLFYRINVISVWIPPLRDRKEDVLQLADRCVERFGRQMNKRITGLSPGARRTLQSYNWPGNVRELENVIERAVALEQGDIVQGESLDLGHVSDGEAAISGPVMPASETDDESALPGDGFDLEEHVQGIERSYISQALQQTGGKKTKAAELLGMSFRSFRYYMKKYNLG